MTLEVPWNDAIQASEHEQSTVIENVTPLLSKDAYIDRIERIRQWIAQGEVYQINATFPMRVQMRGDPSILYKRIANKHPVGHAAFIEDGTRTVLSFSPELFLARTGDCLTTRPMKGTAPRSTDPAEDHAFRQGLVASAKNRAENLMIVDLLRNDLSRVSKPGTVKVPVLCGLETYASVHHLVSVVTGQLRDDRSEIDLIKAAFPCGSITGAPKIKAMEAIAELEAIPRGVYCGTIGALSFTGNMTLNVAIRTVTFSEQIAHFHAGGGITALSDPNSEYEETLVKAQRIKEAFRKSHEKDQSS
jgi:para-aminobenzoate synthetase component 1